MKEYLGSLFKVSYTATTVRTIIYTVGHIFIETVAISLITGAEFQVAGTAAILGPLMSGFWYWIIDRWWTNNHMKISH